MWEKGKAFCGETKNPATLSEGRGKTVRSLMRFFTFFLCAFFVAGAPEGAWASKLREKVEMIDFRPYVEGDIYDFVHKALAEDVEIYEKPLEEGGPARRLTLYIATVDLNKDGVPEFMASMDRSTFEVEKGAENPPIYIFTVDPGAKNLRQIGMFPAASVLLGSLYTAQFRNLLVNPDIRDPTRFITYRMSIDGRRYVVWKE